MRNKTDRDARNLRVVDYARKNKTVGMPEIGEVFGLDRRGIAYILKNNAPKEYEARRRRG